MFYLVLSMVIYRRAVSIRNSITFLMQRLTLHLSCEGMEKIYRFHRISECLCYEWIIDGWQIVGIRTSIKVS